MKLVNFKRGEAAHYGIVLGDRVIDLTARIGHTYPDLISFIAKDGRAVAEALASSQHGDYSFDDLELLAVVPDARKIFCIGLNYADHVAEASRALGGREIPRHPMVFARWAESLTGHRQPIIRPHVSDNLDWEAELLVVIGKSTGRYLPVERALEHVFGYAAMNEACLRDYQFHTRQLTPGKNFEKTGATGPWLVTADEIADPHDLEIEMRLNGELMQKANSRDLIFNVAQLISYISEWLPLNPGDLIATGTMGGVGFSRQPPIFMKPGDLAEVSISGIGVLSNLIADESSALHGGAER